MKQIRYGILLLILVSASINADLGPIRFGGDSNAIIATCTITIPGNYRLALDIVGDIFVNADNVLLDLNEHELSGIVQIYQPNCVLRNGKISTPNDTIVPATIPAVLVSVAAANAQIYNCIIEPATLIQNLPGRDCIFNAAEDVQILDCVLKAGTSGGFIISPVPGRGGIGIDNTGNNLIVRRCFIQSGMGSPGTAFTVTSGAGGDGIRISNNSVHEISGCTIITGAGGQTTGNNLTSGNSGIGINFVGQNLLLSNCYIETGTGGSSVGINTRGGNSGSGILFNGFNLYCESVKVLTGVWDSSGGSSGNGFIITCQNYELRSCTIETGGTGNVSGNSGNGILVANVSGYISETIIKTGDAVITGTGINSSGDNTSIFNCQIITGNASNISGPGIISTGNNIIAQNCSITTGDAATTGTGINNSGDNASIINCQIITGNAVGISGYGIVFSGDKNLAQDSNIITGDGSLTGTGINSSGDNSSIINCKIITGNATNVSGPSIILSGDNCSIQDCVMTSGNSLNDSSQAIMINADNCFMQNCFLITGNALVTGNGVDHTGNKLSMFNCTIITGPGGSGLAPQGSGIGIFSTGDYLDLRGCSITTGFGRNSGIGINKNGDVAAIVDCSIVTGNATIASGQAIVLTSNNAVIEGCAITTGKLPDPSIGVSTGNGIQINSGDNNTITNCQIATGNGPGGGKIIGNGVSLSPGNKNVIRSCTISTGNEAGSGAVGILVNGKYPVCDGCVINTGFGTSINIGVNAGSGGIGIDVVSTASLARIENCIIATGNGGNSAAAAGLGGNGGDCIRIASAAVATAVQSCKFGPSGFGGTGSGGNGAAGRAVNDQNNAPTTNTGQSSIFNNFAYAIANTQKYRIHNSGAEGGVALGNGTPPATAGVNFYDNAYVQ